LLFRKGISGPPPARIEETSDQPTTNFTEPKSTTAAHAEELHPITALRDDNRSNPALDEMTQEEKEREAERLFVLFDRMERNPIISASNGDGDRKGIKEVMREKMENGKGDEWDEEERRRVEKEDAGDEEEAKKEMEAYRRRIKRL